MRTNRCCKLALSVIAIVASAQGPVAAQSVIKVKTAPTYGSQDGVVPPPPIPDSSFGPVTNGSALQGLDKTAPGHQVAPTPPRPYTGVPPAPGPPSVLPPPVLNTPPPSTASAGSQPLSPPGLQSPPSVQTPAISSMPAIGQPYSEYIDNSSSGFIQSPASATYCDPVTLAPPIAAGRPAGWFNRNTGFLRVNTPLSYHMLDFQNRQTDKEVRILQDARRAGPGPSITFGAQLRASVLYGQTNVANKFSYLGRFPPDFVGNTATDIRLLHGNQSMVIHANKWAHGYVETLFSDVFSFQSFNQGSFQVRQAYVVVGDLDQSPFYAFLGKKNVSFGDMGTLSPFSQAMPWHYFAGLAEGGGIGYTGNGLRAQVMALSGGRGIRVVDSKEDGHVNNFAANVRYDWEISQDVAFGIGAGYLHGTIYDVAVPEHIDPTAFGPRNGAWDVNGSIHMGALRLAGEFVQTEEAWPASGRRVSGWRAEAAYDFLYGDTPCVLSGSFGEGNQGAPGTEFEFNRQLVVGLRIQPSPNAFFTFEYVRSTGFAPLIDLTTASDRSVEQNSAVFGLVLAI